MFERAAIFSALLIFIVYGILGMKYLEYIESKNQPDSITATQSQ